MRNQKFSVSILAIVLAAFAVGGAAQQSGDAPQATPEPNQTRPGMMGGRMMGGGMMGNGTMHRGAMGQQPTNGMNGMMGRMMNRQRQMADLTNQLAKSLDAIENEKDPVALKSKLAEHRALLERLQTQMTQQRGYMRQMSGHMMNCPMMGNSSPSPTNK
jgi:hypothetical protein